MELPYYKKGNQDGLDHLKQKLDEIVKNEFKFARKTEN